LHDQILEFQERLAPISNHEPEFLEIASSIGLNANVYKQAMRSPQLRDRIIQDVVRAREANIEAVPTFFIDGQQIHVPLSVNAFVDVIDARLKK